MSFYLMHRGWMDNDIFEDQKYGERDAWAYLIEHAGYNPSHLRHHFKMVVVDRGQVPTSFRKLANKWQWSVNRVRRFLDLLENQKMISQKTDTGFLIITVCNYDKYQLQLKITDTHSDTVSDTHSDTGSDTNIKKINKINKIYTPQFLEFYAVHPGKHGSKEKAFAAYEKALEIVSHETLVSAARKYSEFVKATNAEQHHIAHAVTWLNQKRWEADYANTGRTKSDTREIRAGAMTL